MVVGLDASRDRGLTLERPEREYAFCSHGCLVRFAKSPQAYIPKLEAWIAAGAHEDALDHAHVEGMPTIDAGMREWYRACRCCLSDAHPEVVKMLDAEKEAAAQH